MTKIRKKKEIQKLISYPTYSMKKKLKCKIKMGKRQKAEFSLSFT
jgi:hypothetical protein